MKKNTKISQELLQDIRNEFASFNTELVKKYGVSLSLGNIRFNQTTFSGKILGAIAGDSGESAQEIKLKEEFKEYARVWDEFDGLLGKKFKDGKYEYVLIGYNGRKRT